MPNIVITKCVCVDETPDSDYKHFVVEGTVDGEPFVVTVLPFCGEYQYDEYPESLGDDEDQQLPQAIGQYFLDNNIEVGRVGR